MKRSSKWVLGCAVSAALGLGLVGASQAAVIASDDFTYATGALAGNTGGTGWGAGWTGSGSVAANAAVVSAGLGFRSLAAPIVRTTGQSLYVGFDLGSAPTASGTFSGLSFISGGQEVLFIGGNSVYSLNVTGYADLLSSIALDATPNFVLARIVFGAGTNLTVDLFIDPVGTLGTAAATYTGISIGGNWDAIRLGSGSFSSAPSPIASFDNVVIGTELADVLRVPEPASLALVGAALLALSLTMRRRQG